MRSGITLLLAFVVPLILAKETPKCAQFSTNGSTTAYYNFYRFNDFRNIDGPSASATPYSGWNTKNWFRPASKADTLDMQYTPSEIFISSSTESPKEFSTYLTLHTMRLSNGTQLAGELDYTECNVTYASIRILGRVRGASGAVAGFFTYHNDTTESDIEILTRDPTSQVHYTNQPTQDPITEKDIPDSTFNMSLNTHQSISTWNVHRLDWTPGRSAWYVNGAQSASTDVNVPDAASMIILSMWSNGGIFSGRMEAGSEAWFDVQWVELMFNTTSSSSSASGGTVCSAESSPGTPMPNSSPLSASTIFGTYFWWLVGMMSVLIWTTFG